MRTKNIYIPDYFLVIKLLSDGLKRDTNKISTVLNIHYSNVYDIKKFLKTKGLVDIIKNGRAHELIITEKGQVVARLINELLSGLDIQTEAINKERVNSKIKSKDDILNEVEGLEYEEEDEE